MAKCFTNFSRQCRELLSQWPFKEAGVWGRELILLHLAVIDITMEIDWMHVPILRTYKCQTRYRGGCQLNWEVGEVNKVTQSLIVPKTLNLKHGANRASRPVMFKNLFILDLGGEKANVCAQCSTNESNSNKQIVYTLAKSQPERPALSIITVPFPCKK